MKGRDCVRAMLGLVLGLVCGAALAQNWPSRPIMILLPYGAGGVADITARVIAQKMSDSLHQPVIIDNRPSAGQIVATEAVKSAAPDGYTLLWLNQGHAVSMSLFKLLPYDPVKDFAPVSLVAYFDLVVLAKGDARYQTLGELLAAARAAPGKLNFGTINPGSTQNLSAELFRSSAAIDVSIVPFRTSPEAATALMAGELDAIFESYTAMKSLVAAGRLKPLASTGPKRSFYLPDLPTATEAGVPGYEVVGWNALAAPAGTPT
jgi:tripartite-type tricarboxylate transporter receptor subunit TctC